ncbi:MAG: hypothetical protein ACLVKO_06520 [Dysgonomonas sp.]
MKTKLHFTASLIALFCVATSCTYFENPKRIDHNIQTDTLSINKILEDTSKMMIAELPVYFDSTQVLIMPVGLIDLNSINKGSGRYKEKLSSSKNRKYDDENIYSVVARVTGNDYINGNITNLIFEDLSKSDSKPNVLTNKVINISSVEYLRSLAKKTNRHYLFYYVYDRDSNGDGELNSNDVLSIYISNLDGTEFNKITKDKEDFDSGKWIPFASRYYFRTIEDTNKDGVFDKNDKYHYYYIDFAKEPYQITHLNPIDMIKP